MRTAFNPVIYEVLDFGISIYDANLDLLAEAPGITSFLGANDVERDRDPLRADVAEGYVSPERARLDYGVE